MSFVSLFPPCCADSMHTVPNSAFTPHLPYHCSRIPASLNTLGVFGAARVGQILTDEVAPTQATLSTPGYLKRLGITWLAFFSIIGGPIAYQTFDPSAQVPFALPYLFLASLPAIILFPFRQNLVLHYHTLLVHSRYVTLCSLVSEFLVKKMPSII